MVLFIVSFWVGLLQLYRYKVLGPWLYIIAVLGKRPAGAPVS